MHELSIALAIISQVEDAARRRGSAAVAEVRVRIGELAGVVPDALTFSFELAREGTLLADAGLEVEIVPARARCPSCAVETLVGVPPDLWCSHCGEPLSQLLAGRELEIAEVVLEDAGTQGGTQGRGDGRSGGSGGSEEEAEHVPGR
ncbi:hydrogenase maturation nickel metallochaperone HypA/HybF [Wenjunlia tyrosinilytica]|uniref:Hydrogenase maturation factor HypA n=1 Tax=Wenjunlia tyrosinilytica TaxID=1544741 RepID=A0A917ZNJ6_9ACTN|nr:hydrogenase maturation nickel metallochaperone HypA [Wenjunlia tyrosinilytica]GGO87945.1 hypothetical protein GCM10012280_27590 [Wenjunlia tyrosinilytica]